MQVRTFTERISSRGEGDVHDLTSEIVSFVAEAGIRDGTVTVFVPGSTAGVITSRGSRLPIVHAIDAVAVHGTRTRWTSAGPLSPLTTASASSPAGAGRYPAPSLARGCSPTHSQVEPSAADVML